MQWASVTLICVLYCSHEVKSADCERTWAVRWSTRGPYLYRFLLFHDMSRHKRFLSITTSVRAFVRDTAPWWGPWRPAGASADTRPEPWTPPSPSAPPPSSYSAGRSRPSDNSASPGPVWRRCSRGRTCAGRWRWSWLSSPPTSWCDLQLWCWASGTRTPPPRRGSPGWAWRSWSRNSRCLVPSAPSRLQCHSGCRRLGPNVHPTRRYSAQPEAGPVPGRGQSSHRLRRPDTPGRAEWRRTRRTSWRTERSEGRRRRWRGNRLLLWFLQHLSTVNAESYRWRTQTANRHEQTRLNKRVWVFTKINGSVLVEPFHRDPRATIPGLRLS